MAPLGSRILWRAVPVGLATALVGYLLLQVFKSVFQRMFQDVTVESGNAAGQILGVVVFGLIGFALAASMECVRREKTEKKQKQL